MYDYLRFFLTYTPMCTSAGVQLSGIGMIYSIVKTKNTKNVVPIPFIAIITHNIIKIMYAYLINDTIILIAGCTGTLAGSFYLSIYFAYASNESRTYYLKYFIWACIALTIYIAIPFEFPIQKEPYLGIGLGTTSVLLMASPLCTIRRVLLEQSTKSMSLVMSIALTSNGVMWTLYGFLIMDDNIYIIVPHILGSIAGFLGLSLFVIYPSENDFPESSSAIISESTDTLEAKV